MNVLLMCVISMFIVSCVQVDLFDCMYEDSNEWLIPRNKKAKGDYDNHNPSSTEVYNFLHKDGFQPDENECVACALYNWGGYNTPYDAREAVGSARFGKSYSSWAVSYMLSVKYYGGLYWSDQDIERLFQDELCANWHNKYDVIPKSDYPSIITPDRNKIIEIDNNHYGLLVRMEYWSVWKVIIKDQIDNNHVYDVSRITHVYY